jgi:aconitate hydratase
MFVAPAPAHAARGVKVRRGPNIVELPEFPALPAELELQVLLEVDDDVSTDEIMPAGARVLPIRSNIPAISRFVFEAVDGEYATRARALRDEGHEHAIVAGRNYGQGSSREHAALAPRYLGLRCVLAQSFARIHQQNLVNYGILPLNLSSEDRARLGPGDTVVIGELDALAPGEPVKVRLAEGTTLHATHELSARQIEVIGAGGLIAEAAAHLASA